MCIRDSEWVHGVVHGEPPAEDWVREAADRRVLRLARNRADAAAVAACESPVPDDVLARLAGASAGTRLRRSQVEQVWRVQAGMTTGEDAVAVRIASLTHAERLEWDGEIDVDVAAGHLVGWLLRHDVALDVPTLLAAPAYAAYAVEHRAPGPVRAHRDAMREVRDGLGLRVPLGTQLALLAWVLDQAQDRVSLAEALRSEPTHGRVRPAWTRPPRDRSAGVEA